MIKQRGRPISSKLLIGRPFIAFRMQDTFYTTEKKVCAIIICTPADPLSGRTALKYDHVQNSENTGVRKFLEFARRFPTAVHINFYSKIDRRYLGRIYLTEKTIL